MARAEDPQHVVALLSLKVLSGIPRTKPAPRALADSTAEAKPTPETKAVPTSFKHARYTVMRIIG